MTQTRPGFTLLELMVVLALLIILAAVTIPSFSGIKGNADQKAASDLLRARIADARGLAMSESTAYRLAVHVDGNKVRIAPDTDDFAHVNACEDAGGGATAIETPIEKATVHVSADPDTGEPPAPDSDGWITIGTFLPNGTCLEDTTIVEVREGTFPPIKILLRGVTGTARLMVADPSSSNGGMK